MTKSFSSNTPNTITMVTTDRICKRCLHTWIIRTHDEPTVCPKCKSPYWNKERVVKK